MTIARDILPYKHDFPDHLASYVRQIKDAIKQDKHHDHRRSLFVNFLREAFGVDTADVKIEEKVVAAGVRVRGYIDALYKHVIFEFKRNLEAEREEAKLELKKYFEGQQKPREYVALVSDGLRFEVYQYEAGKPTIISTFELSEDEPLASFRYLDNIIFVAKKITPKSVDLTTRFGLESAVFNKLRVLLTELFTQVEYESSVSTKYREWNALLAKVYGEKLGDPRLFMRHTYLTILSRLMVTQAVFLDGQRRKSDYRGILTGRFFAKKNLPNLAEPDFFSWALGTQVEDDFTTIMSILDNALSVFRLDNISEDLLKEIYQELVDPESRHSLGEYYTPDWIADLALERINYKAGTILDPACGSGTFLLAAIRRLRKKGVTGKRLIEKAKRDILGIDVHPLAVMMSKANILLGLAQEIRRLQTEIYLPVYMADTLLVTQQDNSKTIEVRVSEDEAFHIPLKTVDRGLVDTLVDRISHVCQSGFSSESDKSKAWMGLERTVFRDFENDELFFWKQAFKLYAKLVSQGKDSIWGFILKNAYRPAFIRQQKVDFVVGNPPWLAYRYIKDATYKARVKEMTLQYELLDRGNVKLFTHIDTSTLFFVHCEREFLKEKGTIAFVLPKTTVLPSQQHAKFQERGVTEIHDFGDVSPLFNVRSVLVIRRRNKNDTRHIPMTEYEGRLPAKNMSWVSAKRHLQVNKQTYSFLSTEVKSQYYHPRFLQGATIVPRCFWFIEPDPEAAPHERAPRFVTSSETLIRSKDEWKEKLEGQIEKESLFETVLAKDIVPFAVLRTELIFLPLQKAKHAVALADRVRLLELGYVHAAEWMRQAENLWEKGRRSPDRSLIQWLDYNQKLVRQNVNADLVLLYNSSGTNLAATLYRPKHSKTSLTFKANGFAADAKTYYYYPSSLEEGDFLSAILNSDIVNLAIKLYQPQGLYGERDICRRPFEVCAIPKFDPANTLHQKLASLGRLSREIIAPYVPELIGRVGELRLQVRQVLKAEIAKINSAVRELLREEGQNNLVLKKKKNPSHDLFSL